METWAALTVYFEDPFWVGVYERKSGPKLEVSRIIFGAEPKDYTVYDFLLRNWNRLSFSPPVADPDPLQKKENPKRVQRKIRAQLSRQGIGTKAQMALKLQQENAKASAKLRRREKCELEKQQKYELRRRKQKEKHRGR